MNDFPGGAGTAATEMRTSAPAPAASPAAATSTPASAPPPGTPSSSTPSAGPGRSEPLYGGRATRRVTVSDLAKAKARGEKWPMLTAYDALTAHVFDKAGIPVLLVGDSAGMVVFGHDTTIPVTLDELIPLTAAVVRGTSRALIVADLPFGSYQSSPEAALAAGIRFLKEAGAHAVKLEGGHRVLRQAEELVAAGIPVMGHLGLTPQSVNAFGGYRVQGRGEDGERLLQDAKALEAAGAFAVVLECVPAELGRPGDRRAVHPDRRHRRRSRLRRAGARLAGHGRAVPADPEVRQALRGRGRRARPGRAIFRRRGGRRPVPQRGVLLPLTCALRPRASPLGRRGLGTGLNDPFGHIYPYGDLVLLPPAWCAEFPGPRAASPEDH